jgi:GxxExxY protein
MKIEDIKVNKILDSRGEWTIEVEILSEGLREKASIPSGKSKGSYEAISLSYDEVQKNLESFLNDVKNLDFKNSEEFDKFLIDRAGKNKEKLGANFTLGASIAFARILAKKEGLELWEYLRKEYKLYTNESRIKNELNTNEFANNSCGINKNEFETNSLPFVNNSCDSKIPGLIINLIGGGVHSNNNLDFQEYWLVERRNTQTERRNTQTIEYFNELLAEILNIIKKLEQELPKPLGRNDEGAFCTNFSDNYQPFLYLKKVIHELDTNDNTRINHELDTNDKNENIIFKDLSYKIIGILYSIHSQLGPSFKEEHYKQAIKTFLEKENIPFEIEKPLKLETTNFSVEGIRADFVIDDKILLEIKAKPLITREDIRQVYRYLKTSKLPIGIIANFRSKKLIFKRILNPAALKKSENNSSPFVNNSCNDIRDTFVNNITFNLGADIAANQITKLVNWRNIYKKLKLLDVKYLEDPFKENEFEYFANLRKEGFKVIGDDLTVTNVERLKIALEKKSVDGVIVKPNQVGTILETFEFAKMAKENNLFTIFSHRSGETNDYWLIDLGIAFFADFFKIGPPVQGERVAKYNRLLEIFKNLQF